MAESEQIARRPGRVWRSHDTLFIRAGDGKLLAFRDNRAEVDDFVLYGFQGLLDDIGYFLVEVTYYEGGEYLLINERTGHRTELDALPVLSPDRRRLITANVDLEVGYTPTRMMIFRIGPDSLEKEWSFEPSGTPRWGPSDAVWLDTITVQVIKNVPSFSGGVEDRRTPIVVRRTESGWKVEEDTSGV